MFSRGFVVRRLAVLGALIAFGTSSTMAADLATKAAPSPVLPPVPVFTWTGFYIGANVGWGWAKADGSAVIDGNLRGRNGEHPASLNANGVIGGGQLGYNWQTGAWVFGIEGDIQGSGEHTSNNVPCAWCTMNAENRITAFATVRGRIGWTPFDRGLLYFTGGWAWLNTKHSNTISNGGVTVAIDHSTSRNGWTIGGGYEQMVWDRWSVKLEYLYMQAERDHGTVVMPAAWGGGTVDTSARLKNNVIRVGLNYHF